MSSFAAFFKPLPGNYEPVFTKQIPGGETIRFRSINLGTDLPLIHHWITQPYAARFWQLNVNPAELYNIYVSMLGNPLAHSFIGMLDDRVVCQVDCYHTSQEELREHVPDQPGHCGIHILMCPPRQSRKGLTETMLRAFTEFYFSHPEARVLYGEPDINNTYGNRAAQRAGFSLQKSIALSYKSANLYSITREQFFQTLQHEQQ